MTTETTPAALRLSDQLGPVAEVRDGCLCWHIPHPTYAAAQKYRTGLHLLYAAPRWVPVGESLPERGRTVLACYLNRCGMLRRIRAHWIPAKTVEANTDDECSEYDEDTDTYWTPEGWYEQIDNWGDYSAVAVCEGTVTHWMPMPEPPQLPGAGPN